MLLYMLQVWRTTWVYLRRTASIRTSSWVLWRGINGWETVYSICKIWRGAKRGTCWLLSCGFFTHNPAIFCHFSAFFFNSPGWKFVYLIQLLLSCNIAICGMVHNFYFKLVIYISFHSVFHKEIECSWHCCCVPAYALA